MKRPHMLTKLKKRRLWLFAGACLLAGTAFPQADKSRVAPANAGEARSNEFWPPPRIMDIVVYNHTGEPLEVALVSGQAAVELGLMGARLEGRFEVDVRALGGAGVATLVATGGGPWVMRSDPVRLEGGTDLEFTVTAGGIVWRPARG